MLAQLRPSFESPVIAAIGVLCTWLLVFLPFALYCRAATRADALGQLEAYALGQFCGPVGVWLVLRANRKAAKAEYRVGLAVDQLKVQDGPQAGLSPEEIERVNRELGRPDVLEVPGGRAFRPPPKPGLRPASKRTGLDTVSLDRPAESTGPSPGEGPPSQPPLPPPTKAAGAWQPPPKPAAGQPGAVNGEPPPD